MDGDGSVRTVAEPAMDGDGNERTVPEPEISEAEKDFTPREKFTICTLCYVNLIYYMDKSVIMGLYSFITKSYQASEEDMDELRKANALSGILSAMVFGYFADRYARRALIIYCVDCWVVLTVLSSVGKNYYFFFVCRLLIGIAEAGFMIISPTIIADIAVGDKRSVSLCSFYVAIPVGIGSGYMLTGIVAQCTGSWRYSMLMLAILNLFSAFLLRYCVYLERGEKELKDIGGEPALATSYCEDLAFFLYNNSMMLILASYTLLNFVAAIMMWYLPKFLAIGMAQLEHHTKITEDDVKRTIGLVLILSGIFAMPLGSSLSRILRPKIPWIDPIICGLGISFSVPCFFLAMCFCDTDYKITLGTLFFGQFGVNISYAIEADIQLYITPPLRRGLSMALIFCIPHAVGDLIGPKILKALFDYYGTVDIVSDSDFSRWQLALLSIYPTQLCAGLVFLVCGIYVVADRKVAVVLMTR